MTTNICRRQRCGKMADAEIMPVKECKSEPLSISYHYVAVTSGIPSNTPLLHISYSARRRRQHYNFNIVQGNDDGMFMLKQPSMYHPRAKLVVAGDLMGPSTHVVKIDMSTYHPSGRMRDSRMLTVTIYVSMYNFWIFNSRNLKNKTCNGIRTYSTAVFNSKHLTESLNW